MVQLFWLEIITDLCSIEFCGNNIKGFRDFGGKFLKGKNFGGKFKKMKNFGRKLQKTDKFWWENLKLRILAGNFKIKNFGGKF
jgi:hypothetical protein